MVFVTDVPILAPMMIGIALPTDTWQQLLLGRKPLKRKMVPATRLSGTHQADHDGGAPWLLLTEH